MPNMNRLLYIAFMETIESIAANNYPCLLQKEFLQYASFALVSEDYGQPRSVAQTPPQCRCCELIEMSDDFLRAS